MKMPWPAPPATVRLAASERSSRAAQSPPPKLGCQTLDCSPVTQTRPTSASPSTAEVQGKHAKQSGGRGQYGDVWVRFEPNEVGKGFEFIDAIKGGVVPQEYRNPVQKGIRDTLDGGIIAGYPVVDIKATLYDGSYHDVDSSELAFNLAGALAARAGIRAANPIILEPVMHVEVTTPEEFMGDVIGDLNARRGRIEAMEDLMAGAKLVKAIVPLANMFGYTGDIRSMSQGRAASTMELAHYEEVPPNVAQEIIEKRSK